MLQVLETWSFSKVLSNPKKRVAPTGVSTLQGPGESEERYEQILAAAVVKKKNEKNETKSENVVDHGSAAIASDSHECGAERKSVEEKLLREKGNAEPGHCSFEISSLGPGWVTSKDEGARTKCEPGAAGKCARI
jgi:hypothetical protein